MEVGVDDGGVPSFIKGAEKCTNDFLFTERESFKRIPHL